MVEALEALDSHYSAFLSKGILIYVEKIPPQRRDRVISDYAPENAPASLDHRQITDVVKRAGKVFNHWSIFARLTPASPGSGAAFCQPIPAVELAADDGMRNVRTEP